MADTAKSLIYGCLILSAIGGAAHVWLTRELETAEADGKRALNTLKLISQHALDIKTLEDEKERDAWATKSASNRQIEYFSTCAKDAALSVEPATSAPKINTPGRNRGFEDKTYELTFRFPRDATTGFPRENIAQFLWRLEQGSKLLKVTYLRLEANDRDWNDRWVPKVEVTERKPTKTAQS